jgi:hypothetical protein
MMVIPHSLSHLSTLLRCLHVFDEQRWLTGRGYVGRVVQAELTRRGGKAKARRWHRAWIGEGKLFHPELHQLAFDEKWV